MGKENITGNVSFPHERCFSVLLRNNRKQNIQTTRFGNVMFILIG